MTIIRREDIEVLNAFERDRAGRAVFAEPSIDRLLALRFLEMRGGVPALTAKGRAELLRRRSLERGSRK